MTPLILWLLLFAPATNPDTPLRQALQTKTGHITLPAGEFELTREITLPPDAHDLTIDASKTTIKAASSFRGRALIVIPGGSNIHITGGTFDGNRTAVSRPMGLPPAETLFSRFTPNNGILAENVTGLEIANMRMNRVAGFAILVSGGRDVRIHGIDVADSGSLDPHGRNNATGGILLEEGVAGFEITRCRFGKVSGNGIWTHSYAESPRASHGRIAENEFAMLARDAIQVGHATGITVEGNTGSLIGYPPNEVDMEHQAWPVGIDTGGNVDRSVYRNNHFEEINGKCIDLDGFHDGEVTGNSCVNNSDVARYPWANHAIVMNNTNPGMESRNVRITDNTVDGAVFSGIFVIGSGNVISGNRLRRLNLAHCNEPGPFNCLYDGSQPDILRSGIYLAPGGQRPDPAKGNTIENNTISGFGIARHCIVAGPGVSLEANTIRNNDCSDDAQIAASAVHGHSGMRKNMAASIR
jgi:parallel beta-helix repeat protein